MSYLALARKWRPRTFSQLLGQDQVTKTLINALNQQRLHHAYLFTGTRGVGKTSLARILAKALNCEEAIRAEPCLQCDACLAIEQGRFIDLLEIDGASKTRVEDTRELLDNVQYAPTNGRFKIYLIDEVHMLSQHSFNALLKTLEEPPAHVKFILATTDPQKCPATVLSRCLQFHLRPLSPELITQQLVTILQEEQLDYEIQALEILSTAARGSLRDALSLLDQAITSCDGRLQACEVKKLLGHTQQDYALQLLQALAKQEASSLLALSQGIAEEGGHFPYVLDELLHYFHQMTLYQTLGEHSPLINPSAEIKTLAKQFSAEDLQLFYQFGLKACEEIHLAPTLAIGFQMALLRMLLFRPAPDATTPPLAFLPPPPLSKEATLNLPSAADQDWCAIIPQLNLKGLALNAIENAEFICKEEHKVLLRVAQNHLSLFTPATLVRMETALANYYQSPIKITLSSEKTVQATPAQQKEKITQQKQHQAETALQEDPFFQQLQKEFSAELIKNSIVSPKDDL